MGHDCHVTTMTKAHLPAVTGLCGELGYAVSLEDLEGRFERLSSTEGHAVFIALDGEEVVGFLHAFVRLMLEDGPAAQVQAMVVGEARREQGIGTRLLAEAEAWAGAQGCERLVLYSAEPRADAHAFYAKCGYDGTGTSQRFTKRLDPGGQPA